MARSFLLAFFYLLALSRVSAESPPLLPEGKIVLKWAVLFADVSPTPQPPIEAVLPEFQRFLVEDGGSRPTQVTGRTTSIHRKINWVLLDEGDYVRQEGSLRHINYVRLARDCARKFSNSVDLDFDPDQYEGFIIVHDLSSDIKWEAVSFGSDPKSRKSVYFLDYTTFYKKNPSRRKTFRF